MGVGEEDGVLEVAGGAVEGESVGGVVVWGEGRLKVVGGGLRERGGVGEVVGEHWVVTIVS